MTAQTSTAQTSNANSIKLATGEVVTAEKVQSVFNKCAVVADLYAVDKELLAVREAQLVLTNERIAFLETQIVELKSINAMYVLANTHLNEALKAKNESSAARDEKIKILEDRIKELGSKKTSLWKKILYVIAGAAIGRAIL